jgi:hypothetical protein
MFHTHGLALELGQLHGGLDLFALQAQHLVVAA